MIVGKQEENCLSKCEVTDIDAVDVASGAMEMVTQQCVTEHHSVENKVNAVE